MSDETMREYFSEIIGKQWIKRMEELGLVKKGTFDKFEIKLAPEQFEPEEVVYGESALKDLMRPAKNPFLGKAFMEKKK